MLNVFPEFLTYSLFGPFILRVVVGFLFVELGVLKFRGEKTRWLASFETLNLRPTDLFLGLYALAQIIGGVMLIVGLWTQVAALVLAIFTGLELYVEWKMREVLKRDIVFYILIFIISLSLVLTGAGALAIDIAL